MKTSIPSIIVLVTFVFAVALGYFTAPVPKSISFSAPAITEEGKGRLVEFRLSLQPGFGRLLVNVESVAFKEDIDSALRTARAASEKYLGARLNNYDVVLDVDSDAGFSEVSGGSAGALFAAAIIAVQSGKTLRQDVAISARIGEKGELLPVGGIEEKIYAAQQGERRLFIVSDGQQVRFQDEFSKNISIKRADTISDALPYLLA